MVCAVKMKEGCGSESGASVRICHKHEVVA